MARLSLALGKSAGFAGTTHEKLRARSKRMAKARPRGPAGTAFQNVFRWLLPIGDERRPGDARARFKELAPKVAQPVEACEAIVVFHVAAASETPAGRQNLGSEIIELLAADQVPIGRQRFLKALLQHLVVDFGDESCLASDPVKAFERLQSKYEPADYAFNLACVSAGSPDRNQADVALKKLLAALAPEQFALAAYLLVVRLGALPFGADEARRHLKTLGELAKDRPRPQATRLAEYASECDYGADLASVVRDRWTSAVDFDELMALMGRAQALVIRGEHHGTRVPSLEPDARLLARRFQAWAVGHDLCRELVRTSLFDTRQRDDSRQGAVREVVKFAMQPWLCGPLERMLYEDLYAKDWFTGPRTSRE
jgi:hypothetical protein